LNTQAADVNDKGSIMDQIMNAANSDSGQWFTNYLKNLGGNSSNSNTNNGKYLIKDALNAGRR